MQQNADPVATLKLYKSKSRWIVSKQVMGMTLATVAVGFGLMSGSTTQVHADVNKDVQTTGQTAGYDTLEKTNYSDVQDLDNAGSQTTSAESTTTADTSKTPTGDTSETETEPDTVTTPATTDTTSTETQTDVPDEATQKDDGVVPDTTTTNVKQTDLGPDGSTAIESAKANAELEYDRTGTPQQINVSDATAVEKATPANPDTGRNVVVHAYANIMNCNDEIVGTREIAVDQILTLHGQPNVEKPPPTLQGYISNGKVVIPEDALEVKAYYTPLKMGFNINFVEAGSNKSLGKSISQNGYAGEPFLAPFIQGHSLLDWKQAIVPTGGEINLLYSANSIADSNPGESGGSQTADENNPAEKENIQKPEVPGKDNYYEIMAYIKSNVGVTQQLGQFNKTGVPGTSFEAPVLKGFVVFNSSDLIFPQVGGEYDLRYVPENKITKVVGFNSNLGRQTTSKTSGYIGDCLDVKITQLQGYISDKLSVTATVNENGTITTDDFVNFTPTIQTVQVKPVDSSGNPIPINNNGYLLAVGTTGSVVDAPPIEGYFPIAQVYIPTTDGADTIIYESDYHDYVIQPVNEKGNQLTGIVSTGARGYTGAAIQLQDVPTVQGYTPRLTGSEVVPTNRSNVNVTYVPNAQSITVHLVDQKGRPMKGLPTITIVGKTGDSFFTPSFEGYINLSKVTIPKDGSDQTVEYFGLMQKLRVSIPSNLGWQKSEAMYVQVGEDVLIPVPQLDGFTVNKTTVTGHVSPNGHISVNEAVFYSAIPKSDTGITETNTPTSGTTRSAENGTLPVAPTDAGNVVTSTDATAPTSNKQQEPLAAASNGDSDLNAQTSGKVSGGASNPSTTTTTDSADAPGLAASSEGNVDSLAPTSDDSASASDVVTVSEAGESSATNTKEVSSSSETPQNATNVDAQTLPQTDEEQPSSIPGWGILGLLASCLGFGVAKRKREG